MEPVEIGQRLKQIREHMGYSTADKQFAEDKMQVSGHSWYAWERGQIMIPVLVANRLVEICPGLTLDWIYRGQISGLSTELCIAFKEAAAE